MRTMSPEAQALLQRRYLQKGEDWGGLVRRVVNHVCEGEQNEFKLDVYNQIHNRIWLPNSPCLVSSGTKNGGLMACFVVGPELDELEDHFQTLSNIADVGKFGGGCGFTGTFMRPEGSSVAGSAHGSAYGPNKWAEVVSHALHIITQGNFRSMALMYSISTDNLWQENPDHQFRTDLDDFIDLKRINGEGELHNFNQSIFASDAWLHVAKTQPDSEPARQLIKMANNAWRNGEPGLLFADTINNMSPYSLCGCDIHTTNPCGEQPLPPYGSCNLGSINISHDFFFDDGRFNKEALKIVVADVTRFLDDVGSRNKFPHDRFADWYSDHRPIGIGIMGFADALLRMKLTYGSESSLDFANMIMETIMDASYEESYNLGMEKGFPSHAENANRRNITTVSIAPTGSIAFLADCSHGIEPIFSPIYKRTDERGNEYLFKHPLRNEPYFVSSLNEDENRMPEADEHVKIQAVVQLSTDSAVSKTINLPEHATVQDVLNAMLMAHELGCKGITVYRNNSRKVQVLEELTEEDSLTIDCPTGVCELV